MNLLTLFRLAYVYVGITGVIGMFSALFMLLVLLPLSIIFKLTAKPHHFGYTPEQLRQMVAAKPRPPLEPLLPPRQPPPPTFLDDDNEEGNT